MKIPRTTTISARFPESLKRELSVISSAYDLSLSDLIVRFCRDGLQNYYEKTKTSQVIDIVALPEK